MKYLELKNGMNAVVLEDDYEVAALEYILRHVNFRGVNGATDDYTRALRAIIQDLWDDMKVKDIKTAVTDYYKTDRNLVIKAK